MIKKHKVTLIIIAIVTAFFIAMSYFHLTRNNNITYIDEMMKYANGQMYETVGLNIISDNEKVEVKLLCNKEKKFMNGEITLISFSGETPFFENEVIINNHTKLLQIEQKVEYEITGDTLADNAGLTYQVMQRKTLTDGHALLNVLVSNVDRTIPIRVNGISDRITLESDDVSEYLRTIEYSCKG